MKPIYILGLKRILYFGLPFASFMSLFNYLLDQQTSWMGFCFLFLSYGLTMSLFATLDQKKFLAGIGITDPKAEDLDLISKRILLSPLDPESIKSIILQDSRYQWEDHPGEEQLWSFKRRGSGRLSGDRLIVRIKDLHNGLHELELLCKRTLKLAMIDYGQYPRHLDQLEQQIRLAPYSTS
ncbi:MAG TPA: hypothetical protein VFX48_06985 [Saprospiraceae bacterium]|nr:hypothetical protein [Saprospiraceae bacterium]